MLLKKIIIGSSFIFLITLFSYAPAIRNGYIWDDDDYVLNNLLIRSPNGLKNIWFDFSAAKIFTHQYYPMVFTSFWIDYQLWRLNPFYYHLVNIILHSFNAIIIFLILYKLKVHGAWFAAFIFALHPVHVESVAWISERKNVLSTFFYLLAVLSYIKYLKLGESLSKDTGLKPFDKYQTFYFISLFLYICALLTKTVTCSMPVAILLLLWWKQKKIFFKNLLPLIPFFIIGFIMGILTIWVEKNFVGARGIVWDFSIIDRFLIAGRAIWFYVSSLLWPNNLIFIYPKWQIDSGIWWQYLYPASVIAILIISVFLQKFISNALLIALLFFIITLAPALGFIDIYPMKFSFVADHFQYLASIGLITIWVAGIAILFKKFGKNLNWVKYIIFLTILTLFSRKVWLQSHIYKDQMTLWQDTIIKNPAATLAHNNLSILYYNQGEYEKSIEECQRVIELDPKEFRAYINLGNTYKMQKKYNKAIIAYQKAIELNQNSEIAYNNLGNLYREQSKYNDAIIAYQKAIKSNPIFFNAYNNLAFLYSKNNENDKAVQIYEIFLQKNPYETTAYNNVGVIYAKQKKYKEAFISFQKAVKIDSDNILAHKNLGNLFNLSKEYDKALLEYEKVLKLLPDDKIIENKVEKLKKLVNSQNK